VAGYGSMGEIFGSGEGAMKLYDYTRAPNPRRVRIFLAEKGITVPTEQLDLFTGANRTPEALQRNPYGGLPVLELDEGACIAESVAICRYFEELHPEPRLFGVDAKDRAIVEMWNRRMELVLFGHIGRYFQHTSEIFKTRIKQMPEVAEAAREAAVGQMRMLDGLIGARRFIAGERYTIADITALVAFGLGAVVGLTIDPGLANLTRWHGEVAARPSAKA
jgi:glutathione S-transferase